MVFDQKLLDFRTMRERYKGSSWCLPGSSIGVRALAREIAGLRRNVRTTYQIQQLVPFSPAPFRGSARCS